MDSPTMQSKMNLVPKIEDQYEDGEEQKVNEFNRNMFSVKMDEDEDDGRSKSPDYFDQEMHDM